IEDLSQNRYVSRLKKVSMSGPAELTANLRTVGESVRWDLDADLTDAVIRSEPFFHKPAGVNARVHLGCPVQGEKPLDADFRLSLGETRIAGHATIGPGKSPAVTALTLQSDELQLANLMPLLSLPVEVVEDTGARLALVLNVKEGEPSIAADLSADHIRITSTGSQNAEPFLLELDEIRVSLEEDAVGYRSHLRCRKAKVSPPIPTLVKRGFHPEIMGGVTSPIRIDADIGEFVSEPYRAEQLRCAVLISESQLKLASVTGRLAGGTFELQGNIVRDRKTYSLEYRCEGLDVEQMLSLVPEDSKKFSGELSADVSLSGRLGGFKSRSGQGSLTVTAGRIDSSYIISRMKGLDEAQEPNPIRFDRLRCDFSLDNDTINVSNLHLEKPGLVLRGQGTVTLDGYVDQLFEIEMSREVAGELSARKRWGLLELLPLPNITTRPV
ncbi:MAG: hypothetical protein KAJ01_04385, partial [Candidatus Hydrogenedentes bacterium]|nr:hypothetical protein [Candidatus Hydrogenedentota bacterium]